ncbi:MAG: hypothetical protein ACRCYY_12520 [Trueperaceae bacterium]
MLHFAERYRTAFARFGQPLQTKHALSEELLAPFQLPPALHAYYLVAGNETLLNHSYNRLLAPKDIFVEAGRIVFMEENQNVVYWGVPEGAFADPLVEQGVNSEELPLGWHPEHESCAEFLEVMLYVQTAFGDVMKYSSSAVVDPHFEKQLQQHYQYVGRIGELSAYAAEGCALTFCKWFDEEWRVFGGFNKKNVQIQVAKELQLEWEEL